MEEMTIRYIVLKTSVNQLIFVWYKHLRQSWKKNTKKTCKKFNLLHM